MTPDPETFTYRGRSLEELVPRIREELGDDAVIVARRETTSGGVGGFFAKREIEVEVRPGESAGPRVAAAFAQQLAEAHQRQQAPAYPEGAVRPATSPEIDALPGSANVTVDDLFPAPPRQAQGLAALFNVGMAPPPAEVADGHDAPGPEEPAAAPAPAPASEEPRADAAPRLPEVLDDDEYDELYDDDEPVAEPVVAVEQPTGVFDYLGVGPTPAAVEPAPEPEPEPEAVAAAEPVAPAVEPEVQPEPAAGASPGPGVLVAGLPPAAHAAAERLVARGLRSGLADAIAEEAVTGLAPLLPGADAKDLVCDALARRIPMHPLRRGPGVVGFVGPGGAGKTRCVARLAAAHARHGALPVTVVALRSPDGGAELRRLLAPYGVALHAVESGAEGAARVAGLRGEGLVIVDTPGVSPRSSGELRALGFELDALAPDELHLAVPATIGPAAAQELVGGVRELGVGALVLTHTDETEMLGTVVGLAIDSGLPLSYLARGQAVEAGLHPASAAELAKDLLP
ncbi:MAG: flagellar biosynthesis protein FlhF [Baekduia sp.]|nr:flagellar biosynthesis protein FlhF [Baekduia sp.]